MWAVLNGASIRQTNGNFQSERFFKFWSLVSAPVSALLLSVDPRGWRGFVCNKNECVAVRGTCDYIFPGGKVEKDGGGGLIVCRRCTELSYWRG